MADGRDSKGSTLCSTVSLCHRGLKADERNRWQMADGRDSKVQHCVPPCHCATMFQKQMTGDRNRWQMADGRWP
jgi:hypothetical protein